MSRSTDLTRQAIQALAAAARQRIDKHPLGHLARGHAKRLELNLSIPLAARESAVDDAVRQAEEALGGELEALFLERTVLRPGRIYCLRCGSTECEHSAPPDAREIFAGYGASGLPVFIDFAQWLLERQHPRLDRLYDQPPGLVTEVVSGRELTEELLDAFRDRKTDFHVHGQVVAGWYRVLRPDRKSGTALALTFQVISSRVRGGRRGKPRRRLALNVLGRGPGGEPLEDLYARLGSIPWQGVVHWGQQVLQTIEKAQGRKSTTPEALSRRVEGMLNGIARRLEQDRRARDRRTGHAEKRHTQGDRPTRMAFTDLTRGGDDRIFRDERRETMIVLGERGRAHVFNSGGKLVTSIRYSPESIERKIRREIWRPATAEEIMRLRKKTGAVGDAADGK